MKLIKTQSSDRTGILVVRLWIEGDRKDGLRARITQTLDASAPEEAMATVGSQEDLYAVVRSWVEGFVQPN